MRTNVTQSVFYKVSGVLPEQQTSDTFKNVIDNLIFNIQIAYPNIIQLINEQIFGTGRYRIW